MEKPAVDSVSLSSLRGIGQCPPVLLHCSYEEFWLFEVCRAQQGDAYQKPQPLHIYCFKTLSVYCLHVVQLGFSVLFFFACVS